MVGTIVPFPTPLESRMRLRNLERGQAAWEYAVLVSFVVLSIAAFLKMWQDGVATFNIGRLLFSS